ncbi:MAG TPA: hypothetical protein VLI43_10585 [Gemmatimonadaceae bacterium]|nr:hypothetical protein [Gemmatimonadaceae bacterium]
MSEPNSSLSPRGAVVFGIIAMLCGVYPVLAGLGVVHVHPAPGAQPWVAVAAGSAFILAGLAIINGYAIGGASQADGSLPDSAPLFVRVTQYVLGIGILGLMFALFAWVAFGPGERQFSSSISLPFWSGSDHSSERSGRIAFGIGAGFMGLFLVVSVVSGARRLWRGGRGGSQVD